MRVAVFQAWVAAEAACAVFTVRGQAPGSMTRHPGGIRWWTNEKGQIICTRCGRRLSHVAFRKRDGTLVDFEVHW